MKHLKEIEMQQQEKAAQSGNNENVLTFDITERIKAKYDPVEVVESNIKKTRVIDKES